MAAAAASVNKENNKAILLSTLGTILGFDDGAEDVLDHLLSIESREDLLEYLSQLLGDTTSEVKEFVDNIGHYQRGEPLKLAAPSSSADAVASTSNNSSSHQQQQKHQNQQQQSSTFSSNDSNIKQTQSAKQQALQNRKKQKQTKSRVPQPAKPKKKNPPPPSPANNNVASSNASSNGGITSAQHAASIPIKTTTATTMNKKASPPLRGQAKTVCGCFGTKHKALTNCLHCGRIICEKEGYGFCPFCGYMVEEVVVRDGIDTNDKAWIQKERLLQFDREFARRTQIFDDQADYQSMLTSTDNLAWMTREEQEIASKVEDEKVQASRRRPNQTLKLSI